MCPSVSDYIPKPDTKINLLKFNLQAPTHRFL